MGSQREGGGNFCIRGSPPQWKIPPFIIAVIPFSIKWVSNEIRTQVPNIASSVLQFSFSSSSSVLLFLYFSSSSNSSSSLSSPCSGVLRTQKLKTHLVRSQSSKALHFKPGAGLCIAMHATPTAREFFLANFYPSGPFTWICSKTSPEFFAVLAVANTGSCVGPHNKTGHPAHCYRQLMQVHVPSARGI